MVLERMMEIIEREEVTDGEDKSRCLLTSSQRVSIFIDIGVPLMASSLESSVPLFMWVSMRMAL